MEATTLWTALTVFGIISLFFDVHYYIYSILVIIVAKLSRKISSKDFQHENIHYGFCFTTDLDLMFHMNNARYLRECDFGRFIFLSRTGMLKIVQKLGGSMILGGSTIRYRKSINFLSPYHVSTKIVSWDDKAFYLEQKFIRPSDKFVYAIVLIKQTTLNVQPKDIVKMIRGVEAEPPELPEEFQKWIECNQISSQKLRNGKNK